MEAIKSTFEDVVKLSNQKKDGLVMLGAGGDINEWLEGVPKILKEHGVASSDKFEDLFSQALILTSTGGRTDLVLVFAENPKLEIGRLAMWRLRAPDCSWISDFVVNYRDHYDLNSFTDADDQSI